MHSEGNDRRVRVRWVWPAALAAALVMGPAAGAASKPTPPRPTLSFASGTVAALNGSTMEVQSTTGQTTVSVSSTTTFSQIEPEGLSAITVGTCVRATGSGTTASGIKATTVSVSKATSSGCTLGFGSPTARAGGFGGAGAPTGRFRGAFGGANGTRPSFPANGRRPANFATATGSVTAVKGSALTVKARVPEAPAKKNTKNARPRLVTKSVKVTVGSSATVTTTAPATVAQLLNGVCVSAFGTANDTGAIAARSITISQPVKGTCTAGFGGFGGFGGGGGRFGGGAQPT